MSQRKREMSPLRSKGPPQDSKNVEPSVIYLMRECFNEILSLEGDLEQARMELRELADFTLPGIFNLFTGYSQARIGPNEILGGLERIGLFASIDDLDALVGRYDADEDGKLSFWEFSNALLPIDPVSRDELERRKPVWEIGYETKEVVRKVFRKLLDAEKQMEQIRVRIHKERGVDLGSAFTALDWLSRGYLTCNEFKKAFNWHTVLQESTSSAKMGSYVRQDQNEIEGMIRRFNKDKLNGRIRLHEFIEELTPKSLR